ncbi:MAG: hypothetical protein R3B13_02995 [Polyangiaceae bacterium]
MTIATGGGHAAPMRYLGIPFFVALAACVPPNGGYGQYGQSPGSYPTEPQAGDPNAPAPAQQVGGGGPASCPAAQQDQLAQLLASSPWCNFSYSGTSNGSGTTGQERVVFATDGRFTSSSSRESSYSGTGTDQYGNTTNAWGANGSNSNSEQGCWRTEGTTLHLSPDGNQWGATPVSVSHNSNGYPIITANGKEYSQCN